MPKDNKYLKYPRSMLENQMELWNQKSVEAELAGQQEAVTLVEAQLELIAEALAKVPKAEPGVAMAVASNSASLSVQKFVEAQINAIDEFRPGVDVSKFLQAAENAFGQCKLQGGGESLLVKYLPLRFCQDYRTAWNKYNDATPITTFADFKAYMQTTHANPTTTFQLLDKFDLIEKFATESYTDYAVRITNQISALAVEVAAKFKKETGRDMQVDDVFKIFGGVAMIREVRKNKECYAAIMLSVKNDFDAQSIGTLAASYQNCSEKSDPILIDSNAAINVSYSGQNTRRVCKYDGNCYRFPSCHFIHEHQKSRVKKKKEKADGGDNNGSSRRPSEQQVNYVDYGDDDDENDNFAYEISAEQVFRQ